MYWNWTSYFCFRGLYELIENTQREAWKRIRKWEEAHLLPPWGIHHIAVWLLSNWFSLILEHFVQNCYHVHVTRPHSWCINTGLGHGLVLRDLRRNMASLCRNELTHGRRKYIGYFRSVCIQHGERYLVTNIIHDKWYHTLWSLLNQIHDRFLRYFIFLTCVINHERLVDALPMEAGLYFVLSTQRIVSLLTYFVARYVIRLSSTMMWYDSTNNNTPCNDA